MQKQQALLMVLLLSCLVAVQGCLAVAVGAGAGTAAYIMGKLQTVEAKDLNTVYKAAEKAIGDLELTVSKKTKDAMSAEITARDSEDKKIKIKLDATAEGATKLSIRVGIFGNETKSRLIYEQIKKYL